MRAPRSGLWRVLFAPLLLSLVLGVSTPSPGEASAPPALQWLDARIVPARAQLHLWEHKLHDRRQRVRQLSIKLGRVSEAHGSLLRADGRDVTHATARVRSAERVVSVIRERLHFYVHARSKILAAMRGAGVSGLPVGSNYGRWAAALLSSIGAPNCRSDLQAIVAWETAESTQARYNPLATTVGWPGSYASSHSGVQNFVSFSAGIAATRATLVRNPWYFGYSGIIEDLLSCAPAWTTANAIHDSYWCRGCGGGAYVVNQLPAVQNDWVEYASRSIGIA